METKVSMKFDVVIAKELGTDSAIILQNIEFWMHKNFANGKNVYDDKVWTYNSINAWASLFNWLSIGQIRRCLTKLEESGYLLTGNYNKLSFDKTKWYSSARLEISTCRNGQLDLLKSTNGVDKTDNAIPYKKPNIKPINNNKGENEFSNLSREEMEELLIELKSKEKTKEKVPTKRKVFVKPSVEEINTYITEKGFSIDAEAVFDFYESKGWMVGRNKMKDWKASVRTWERKELEKNKSKHSATKHKMTGANAVINPDTSFDY